MVDVEVNEGRLWFGGTKRGRHDLKTVRNMEIVCSR
jgi:hypothetical protein